MSEITNLPLEMLLIIFKDIGFLNLQRLRSTCKLWRYIIDNNAIVEELIIINDKNWYDTSYYTVYEFQDKIINLNQIRIKENELFEKLINLNVLNNLKTLVISYSNYLTIINFISNFSKLKLLAFNLNENNLENKCKIIYYLSNSKLEKVYANFNQHSIDFEFQINCPNLIQLIFDDKISKLKIDDINKIDYLSVKYPAEVPKDIIPVNLDKFTQLKIIHIKWDNNIPLRSEENYNTAKLVLSNLFDYKQNSKKELAIYFNKIKLEDKDHAKKLIDEKKDEEKDYFDVRFHDYYA